MLITVQCAQCQKRYKIDSRLGGRTAKCKNCGGAIDIPLTGDDNDPPTDDLMAGLMAAATAETGQSAVHPGPTAVRSAPAPVPPVASGAAAAEAASVPCPACGRQLPPTSRICVACGFDRATGRRAGASAVEPGPANYSARNPRGYRKSVEYQTPILSSMDNALMQVGLWVFWLLVLFLIFMSIALTIEQARIASARNVQLPGYVYLRSLLSLPIALCLWTLVQVPLSTFAVRIAGLILLFEVPEEARWRVLFAQVIALLYALIGWAIVTLRLWTHELQNQGFIYAAVGGMIAVPVIALFTLPLSLATHFLVSWLLLRLSFIEHLLAWTFQCIAMAIFGGLMFVLGIVLAIIFG